MILLDATQLDQRIGVEILMYIQISVLMKAAVFLTILFNYKPNEKTEYGTKYIF